jgi:ankyrin repeat protein
MSASPLRGTRPTRPHSLSPVGRVPRSARLRAKRYGAVSPEARRRRRPAGSGWRVALIVCALATTSVSGQSNGLTPLHEAVQRNDLTAVMALVKKGTDVNAATRYGVTPLYLACLNGNAAVVERLLAAGADVNAALPDGETALMTAARTGDAATVKALLARGATITAVEKLKGQDALMWAAAENNAAVVRLLVEAGADLKRRSRGGTFTPFLFAVRAGHLETTRTLLDLGADVNETMPDGTSALVMAVINAHYELAGMLLERGADPDADGQGWTALHQIAWSRRHNAGFNLPGPVATGSLDSLELARRLVARGADVNARQKKEPRDGNRNMLNRIGSTALLLAAKSADVPLMRVLLELGADASITTTNGTTVLMAAAGVGIWAPGENPGTHEEALAAVKLAHEAGGGAVNDIDKDGETALHGAVYRGGNVLAIQYLIDKGSRFDVVNKRGWTALTAADGVEYTPDVLKRYPEASALIRKEMQARGLAVPESTQPGAESVTPLATALLNASSTATAKAGPAAAGEARARAEAARAGSEQSIWGGVYSEDQAGRGEKSYMQACARCHADDLQGSSNAPALVGDAFFVKHDGSPVDEVVERIRRTMPQEAPDSLSHEVYTDIVAFMLKQSGVPAGPADLPADRDKLRQLMVTRGAR